MDATGPIDLPAPEPRRRWKRAVIFGLLSIGVGAVLAAIGAAWWVDVSVHRRLAAAEAAAAEDLPGWRLAELEASRRQFAPGENAADLVLGVIDLLPQEPFAVSSEYTPTTRGDFLDELERLPPNARPDDALERAAAASLDEVGEAVSKARGLAEMGEGRFPLEYAQNAMETLLPGLYRSRDVDRLLCMDAARRSYEGDIDGALQSSRAVLGVARAIGDEPFGISQLYRAKTAGLAMGCLERALGQGEADDASLARAQEQIALEADQLLGVRALRGERAIMNDLMYKMETGELDFSDLDGRKDPLLAPFPAAGAFYRYNRALLLERLNRSIEIAARPLEEQMPLWVRYKADSAPPTGFFARASGMLANLLSPAAEVLGRSQVRRDAQLRCGLILLAAERYRLARGDWPATLGDLAPVLPSGFAPVDSFGEADLTLLRTDDGLIVYSVGMDGQDDGGNISPKGREDPGFDLGFRLWDVAARGIVIEPEEQSDQPLMP